MSKLVGRQCARCAVPFVGVAYTMSFFNTDLICLDCQEKEANHPRYKEAVDREIAACEAGDYNFVGIGKPGDL